MDRIWDILQIEETTDQGKIRRAYAARCRELHPEEKPQEFQALYCAYQAALQYASSVGKGPARGGRAPEAEQKREDKAVSGYHVEPDRDGNNFYRRCKAFSDTEAGPVVLLEPLRPGYL